MVCKGDIGVGDSTWRRSMCGDELIGVQYIGEELRVDGQLLH